MLWLWACGSLDGTLIQQLQLMITISQTPATKWHHQHKMTIAKLGHFAFSFSLWKNVETCCPSFFLHQSFVCLVKTVFQVRASPSDKPLSIFKAPVSWTGQPCGPSNFTTHLWGHGEGLMPAESVYMTVSVERKSISSHLDHLNPNIIAILFAFSSPSVFAWFYTTTRHHV